MSLAHYDHSWIFTIPPEQCPSIDLPVFSDDPASLSEHTMAYGRGAQNLANFALAFAAEAVVMENRDHREVHDAIVAGQLTVGLTVFENDPAIPDATTEIRAVRMNNLRSEAADWSCKLAITPDRVQVSADNKHTVQAEASFRHDETGGYVPEQLSYTKHYAYRPYLAERRVIDFAGLVSYSALIEDYRAYRRSTPREVIEPLQLLDMNRENVSWILAPPVRGSARIAIKTSA